MKGILSRGNALRAQMAGELLEVEPAEVLELHDKVDAVLHYATTMKGFVEAKTKAEKDAFLDELRALKAEEDKP